MAQVCDHMLTQDIPSGLVAGIQLKRLTHIQIDDILEKFIRGNIHRLCVLLRDQII